MYGLLVLIGIVVGLIISFIIWVALPNLIESLWPGRRAQRQANMDAIIQKLEGDLAKLSLQVLTECEKPFLALATQKLSAERELGTKELEEKKKLIDQQLGLIKTELGNVSQLVKDFREDRAEKFGKLTSELKTTGEQTSKLIETTNKLREVLSSSRQRGQWGQRIAEDVLRMAGFIENVNYTKQKVIEGVGTKPDYTFSLPRSLKLNMDVKFPLDNYANYVNADSDTQKETFRINFLRDIKGHIKTVASREYINPEQNTVDCALLFIPSDQIFAFIHEQGINILDESIKNKVVFCSPITLFAVLAIIRAAVDNFVLEQASNELLSLFGMVNNQWKKFTESMVKLGKRIKATQEEYEVLSTTRLRELKRPLSKIEEVRTQRGLPVATDGEEESLAIEEEDTERQGE